MYSVHSTPYTAHGVHRGRMHKHRMQNQSITYSRKEEVKLKLRLGLGSALKHVLPQGGSGRE